MGDPNTDRRRFEVRRCLGAGGFGEVYLASMVSAGGVRSEVALKVLHTGLDPRSQAVQRLKDEAKLLGLLNHPSILRIHDLVLLEDRVTLVTEFVDGADLDQCVCGDDPIPVPAVLNVLGKVADALNAAYNQPGQDGRPLELLHRDIKPSNIRIGKHGEVKLLDFGIAKAAGFDREAKTQTNAVIGSFPYMAPERFDRSGDTTASDVYSLGCVLFEALTTERLHADMEVRQLFALAMVEEKHDARLQERLPLVQDVHPEVVGLMMEMLAFDPAARPTLDALGVRCEDLADEVTGKNLSRWSRRRAWPEVSPEEEGLLAGRTITEASLSKTSNLLTGSRDHPEISRAPRSAPPPTGLMQSTPPESEAPFSPDLAAPTTAADFVDPAPAPAPPPPAPAAPPAERAPPPTSIPPARAAGSARTGLLVVGALAVLMAGVLLLAIVIGGGTVAAFSWGGGEETTVSTVSASHDEVPGATDEVQAADGVAASAASTPPRARRASPSPVNDGTAEVAPADAATDGSASGCQVPLALEPAAILGQLTEAQRSCLSTTVRDVSQSQTERGKLGRVLLVDAKTRCQTGGGCASYESEQRYFFEEIDRSDAEMLYTWVTYLYGIDSGDDSERAELLGWVDKTLERKSSWAGVDYVKRVDRLYEVGGKVAYKRFETLGGEKARVDARNRLVQWLNNRVQLNKDSAEALSLCASAAGSKEACKKRMHDNKAQATLTFVSIPVGASITVDGQSVGDAPLVLELDYGDHQVQMTSGDVTGTQAITVGSDGAVRWIWRSKEDRWESSF